LTERFEMNYRSTLYAISTRRPRQHSFNDKRRRLNAFAD
jgi:hypothetical protein